MEPQRRSNRTRFAPNVAAAIQRPIKADPAEATSASIKGTPSTTTTANLRSGRGRGQGRFTRGGGPLRGLERSTLLDPTTPSVVSGPFAHGPATMARARSDYGGILGGRSQGHNTSLTDHQFPSRSNDMRYGLTNAYQNNNDSNMSREALPMEYLTFPHKQPGFPMRLGGGEQDKKYPALTNETKKSFIEDEIFTNGSILFGKAGVRCLLQLPSCVLPNSEGYIVDGPTATASLLGSKSETGKTDEETAMDIDTYKSLQEAAAANQEASKPRWPMNCQGWMGKMRIHQSGRISLQLGEHLYWATTSSLTTSTSSSSSTTSEGSLGTGQHRLVAVDGDYQQSFDLGTIQHKLIFIPSECSLYRVS